MDSTIKGNNVLQTIFLFCSYQEFKVEGFLDYLIIIDIIFIVNSNYYKS